MFRRHNYIKNLGADEEQIEHLMANLLYKTNFILREKIVDLVNQLFQLSKSESIPPAEVPACINQKIEEKKRLEQEIQKSRAILDQESVDVQNLSEHKKSKEQLKEYGLLTEAPDKLISVIQSFSEMGYDPQKIITSYARIKSLRKTVRVLCKECRILESRAARYKEILPLCEQIDSFGIGFPELVVFRSAAFRIVEMEKQLNDTMMKIQMVNLVSARQSDAVIALAKLQCYGITENQILNLCKTIEVNGQSMTGAQPTNSNSYYAF